MKKFQYVAWIIDHRLPARDKDAEWPVMFVVSAPTALIARAWGDRLARRRFPHLARLEFSWSLTVPVSESTTPGLAQMPVVVVGEDASDAEIGW
jgi:hypothetical protein